MRGVRWKLISVVALAVAALWVLITLTTYLRLSVSPMESPPLPSSIDTSKVIRQFQPHAPSRRLAPRSPPLVITPTALPTRMPTQPPSAPPTLESLLEKARGDIKAVEELIKGEKAKAGNLCGQ